MTGYLLCKALHIVSMVAWFAGLFYLPRLFVYAIESEEKAMVHKQAVQDQLGIMQRRLYHGIMWPAMVATLVFGAVLMVQTHAYTMLWMQLKLLMVLGLVGYHLYCGKIRRDLAKGVFEFSSRQMRFFNEVPTLFLLAIVLIVCFK